MKEVKITNLVKFYALLLLYDRPKHGYEIMKCIGGKTGKDVSAGEIYPFLELLKRKRYVEIKKIGKREKKIYSLTASGRKFVKKMLLRFSELIDIAVEPSLKKCAHCGCEIYKGGHKEKIKGRKLIFCCQHCARSFLH